jgi:hypothetical protein
MSTAHETQSRIRLGRGESFWLSVKAGTVFVGLSGSVVLTEAPRWLADTTWRAGVPVHVGQAHAVDAPGWVQLRADAPAELLCVRGHAAPERAARLNLAGWLRTFARHTLA